MQKCEATAAAYVVKTLSRAAVAKERQQVSVMAEVMLLREIQHPLIVTLHGSHKTANSLCLIFEPILGGDMFSYLTSLSSGLIPEVDARFYAACIVAALGHVHSHSVVFRDLKVSEGDRNCSNSSRPPPISRGHRRPSPHSQKRT